MILDTDYITENGKPVIRVFKKENGEFKIEYDRTFEPYFYALLKDDSAIEDVKKVTAKRHGTVVRVKRAEKVQKKFLGRPIEVWKLYFTHPQDVPAIRDKIRAHPAVIDIYEYDIPFAKRYLIDKGLIPMEGDEELTMLAFDIETLYHEGEEFGTGPILMISYADGSEARVITWKKINLPYVDVVSTEKEMIKRFLRVVREKDPDVLITYNGDNFDFAYLKKRCEELGIKFTLGRDGSEPKIQRMGDRFAVEVKGRIHFDLYPVIRRTINLPTYTLEAVYEAVFGKPKEKVYAEEIAQAWESGEGLERVARYSMEDAKVTYELGREFFPMEAQLSRLIGQSLWDVSRSSTGNLVEWFLLRKAYERNELAPNKPDERELARRRGGYAGGYVKEPERGLWDNIVYLDFRCHPADTKVVVKGKGIINISEVREGDYVLGIDGWQKVKKVWEYDYEGELININGLKCTPNHKLPVVGKNERQTRIRDSLAKSFLTKKVRGRLITTPLFEKIGKITKQNVPEEEVLKGELAGIILAEGTLIRKDVEYFDSSRGKKRISHQYRVEITVGEHEEEFIGRIVYIFEKLFGITPRITRKEGTKAVTLKIAKKEVYLKAKELMDNVENLHAPSVLRGFFEGDGTVNRVRRTIVANQGTNNKWKIEIVSKLLEKLEIPHSKYTYEYTERGKNLTRYIIEITGRDGLILFQTLVGFISTEKNQALSEAIRGREMNRLEDNAFYSLSEFKATKEYYKGKVYDLTLEGTPYYFANGILTHNSLYPSIIITHNVSPDTLNREGCKEYDVAPEVGHKFCKDFPGFIPSLLGDLLEERQKIKRKMKATVDPLEKKLLDYRQRAIKILANSFYGYYGYAKARWYCRECAESVTAWGREYIETTIREIEEKFGFKVLYADTDGFFATIPGADAETVKKKAKEFLKYINAKLPGLLELEYEGFYVRGFFVTKKKYAVIDEEGKITTRGLEIVRRDWSEIAKETQARVLEAILKHGDVEEAVRIVKEVTEKLSKYEVPPEKLVIHEQITRDLRDYKATGPHVAVAKRLAARGVKIRPGTVISYIVLKGSGRIGDRAIPFDEFDPTKHRYDAEYYIENQVLPAVERILKAFGYRKEDLRYQKTKQVGLGAWLKVKK
ncbi:DNA polymerase [Thermococcus nautili]|uniref:DNA polymerase domain-containing protein n=1 Tax=Thermococcus nautili TaxID=195522 RepID=UPI002557A79A|nr:DNA polymerase domain-containing protein [Thermococcus nautili]CAI1492196.1 DNA polymerase [Thermococcus nautili]